MQNGGDDDGDEMAATVGRIAELALLGVGAADQMFPDTLEEWYGAAYGGGELTWRVAL